MTKVIFYSATEFNFMHKLKRERVCVCVLRVWEREEVKTFGMKKRFSKSNKRRKMSLNNFAQKWIWKRSSESKKCARVAIRVTRFGCFCEIRVSRFGCFCKILTTKFLTKVAQIFVQLLGRFLTISLFNFKLFLQLLCNFRRKLGFFYSNICHTGLRLKLNR